MQPFDLLAFALALLVFGLFSKRIEASYVTPPMAFCAVGFLLGPGLFDLCSIGLEEGVLAVIAELTLALMLFNDASKIDARALVRERSAPLRMLVLGLPLAVALGGAAALVLLPELGLWPAFLLAALLAPTDAALGQVVVTSRRVPEPTRRAIEVESGLNDGLALPAVLTFAALAGAGATGGASELLHFVTLQLVLGPLVGFVLGRFGGRLAERSTRSGWMGEEWQRLVGVGLAVGAYALAESVEGNGFIAAFVAGLALDLRHRELAERIETYGHTHAEQLALLLFMVFGASSLPEAATDSSAWIYALLSLVAVRGVAIALSLLGSGQRPATVAFMGWFGPRGLATILFATVVVERGEFAELERVLGVVYLTVGLSILLHGLTAIPFSKALERRVAAGG